MLFIYILFTTIHSYFTSTFFFSLIYFAGEYFIHFHMEPWTCLACFICLGPSTVNVKNTMGWSSDQNQIIFFNIADKATVVHKQKKKHTRSEVKKKTFTPFKWLHLFFLLVQNILVWYFQSWFSANARRFLYAWATLWLSPKDRNMYCCQCKTNIYISKILIFPLAYGSQQQHLHVMVHFCEIPGLISVIPINQNGCPNIEPKFFEQGLPKYLRPVCILRQFRHSNFLKTFITAPKTIVGTLWFHTNTL